MDFGLQSAFGQIAGTTLRVIRAICVTPGDEYAIGYATCRLSTWYTLGIL